MSVMAQQHLHIHTSVHKNTLCTYTACQGNNITGIRFRALVFTDRSKAPPILFTPIIVQLEEECPWHIWCLCTFQTHVCSATGCTVLTIDIQCYAKATSEKVKVKPARLSSKEKSSQGATASGCFLVAMRSRTHC